MGCTSSSPSESEKDGGRPEKADQFSNQVVHQTQQWPNDGGNMSSLVRTGSEPPPPLPTDQQQMPMKTGVKLFIAKYDYDARTDEDLSFKKGELLEVLDDTCGDWWRARSRTTQLEGYVPNNFVAEVKSLDAHE